MDSSPSPALVDVTSLPHPVLDGLFYTALGLYGLCWLIGLRWPSAARSVLAGGIAVHLAATVGRGWAIGFLPLTNKFESFSGAALCVAIVALATWGTRRLYNLSLLGIGLVALGVTFFFPIALEYPPPLMRTIWYPLHVPLSFLSYGLWAAAAVAGVVWIVDRETEWLRRVDRLALQGFALWSLSMIAGGFWGVVAWGAYFLWDPKIIWSVILWFHYATFVHLRLTPSLQHRLWIRPALALVGLIWTLIAYVGTSFLFGSSSHAF